PNLTVDIPALNELSRKMNAPICGKDFKTGQTFIKTVLAPAFKTRMLGVSGWYSTNILGNRDGEVLDDPESFKTKEESKLGVLDAFAALAARATSLSCLGIEERLSFYFKGPDSAPSLYPEHHLFIQTMKLKNTLRHTMGDRLIPHHALAYYGE